MAYRFLVGETKSGDSSWWLYAENGEMTAWAGETFASPANARRAASSFKTGAISARYETYPDGGGVWRWRAWTSSDKVASSGESFANSFNAQLAAERVRDNAGTATGL